MNEAYLIISHNVHRAELSDIYTLSLLFRIVAHETRIIAQTGNITPLQCCQDA